jgi:hypothetical protein
MDAVSIKSGLKNLFGLNILPAETQFSVMLVVNFNLMLQKKMYLQALDLKLENCIGKIKGITKT